MRGWTRVTQTTLLPRAAEMRNLPLGNVSLSLLLPSLWCWGWKSALLILGKGPTMELSHTSGFYSPQEALYSPAFLGRYSDLLDRESTGMHVSSERTEAVSPGADNLKPTGGTLGRGRGRGSSSIFQISSDMPVRR